MIVLLKADGLFRFVKNIELLARKADAPW